MITKTPTEKLGMSIKGGAKNVAAGPADRSDEGIFISRVGACSYCHFTSLCVGVCVCVCVCMSVCLYFY